MYVYIPHTGSDVRKKFGSSDALRFAITCSEADIIHISVRKGHQAILGTLEHTKIILENFFGNESITLQITAVVIKSK